jgi:hypothetical protein
VISSSTDPTTKYVSTTTEEWHTTIDVSTTEETVPTTSPEPKTTNEVAHTTIKEVTTSEEAVPITTQESITTKEVAHTTIDASSLKDETGQTDEVVQTSTADRTTSSTVYSSVTQHHALQSNVPGITLESISVFHDLPEGCFEGIGDLCQSSGSNVTSCSNSTVSDQLVDQVLNLVKISIKIPLFIEETDFSTSVTHSSICEENQENDWIETYEIISTKSREPNSTYDIALVLRTPTFTSASFLQISINSFGTSSVQHACYFLNEDAVMEFSSVPGGIVGGYTVSEDVYDCSYYVTAQVQLVVNGNSSSVSFEVVRNGYPDLSDDVGLAMEYLIVCIYILVSAYGAYRSYIVHQQQRTRSDYKTNINIGFIALFSIWAFGNLLYMVIYTLALTEMNFFYIKQILTLTYFIVYLGFTLLIQYRYCSL